MSLIKPDNSSSKVSLSEKVDLSFIITCGDRSILFEPQIEK
ncbi:MAG: hypothetical protein V7K98_17710 [Nostoc sp.]